MVFKKNKLYIVVEGDKCYGKQVDLEGWGCWRQGW